MTPSGWIDLIIVLVVVVAVSSGLRQGAVASALAFFGVVLGAVAGILIAPHVLVHIDEGNTRLLAGVATMVTAYSTAVTVSIRFRAAPLAKSRRTDAGRPREAMGRRPALYHRGSCRLPSRIVPTRAASRPRALGGICES